MYLMSLPRNYNKRTLKFQRKFPRDHEGATSLNYMHKTNSFEEAVSFCERADLRNESAHARNCLCTKSNKQWLEGYEASYINIETEF